jgi:hypothetical protein
MAGAAVEKRKYIQNEAAAALVNDMTGLLTANSPFAGAMG